MSILISNLADSIRVRCHDFSHPRNMPTQAVDAVVLKRGSPISDAPLCACGCGATVTGKKSRRVWARYLPGHAQRMQGRGPAAHRWKGGITKHKGYVLVLSPDHPRAQTNGYVRRAILVAEQKLGRSLAPKEVVHHVNAIRDDDRPENIEVLDGQSRHMSLHNIEAPRVAGIRIAGHLGNTRLSDVDIETIRTSTESQRALMRRYGACAETIRTIRGKWPKGRLTDDEVRAIRKAPGSSRAVGKRFGVNYQVVLGIRRRKYYGRVEDLPAAGENHDLDVQSTLGS